ncbi:gamma-glutamylcyclotransferase [Pseudomonas aeruginosa]|uniref:hypothetical protein n=1 Tax=Pseudomonas aeruginosa TaxID=287 RepID=UPI00053D7D30|nr:hypothetical protein [Pseudomonas aeruginosa]ELH0226396.1 gamma-glutamylcyclotransferase [Pseudomonas aeruginosa]MBH4115569.1 gamma-glutamylcyclotransferase [Pseudomonas aeruginosa]MBI8951975.1 gamma-glutamylcyclotransferase [Pseudomonas aeruginosa]MCS8013021.1 gamma-glutamylcyclotransferase [Pseudomonas aeruginosa]MCT1206199.1 gamma-glutamylcyclotransferase [Pseudomonas aeruginosa]
MVDEQGPSVEGECVFHDHPVPPDELSRYSPDRDFHAERDIASYVEGQAPDEVVLHVEKIKKEVAVGEVYEIWDVTTDKDRWWVITNLTNLYSQKYFPSLDYTISFHIGLMMRLRSKPEPNPEPGPFDEIFRRMDQAEDRLVSAVEAEDFQSVGMLLREALVTLILAVRGSCAIPEEFERPQDANFIAWSDVLMNLLCPGTSNKPLRQHLKTLAKEAWQLTNWLTHSKSAGRTASSIAMHSCQTVIGHMIQILDRSRQDRTEQCPVCKSRDVRTHFDIDIPPGGDSYLSCGVCDWDDHPGEEPQSSGA